MNEGPRALLCRAAGQLVLTGATQAIYFDDSQDFRYDAFSLWQVSWQLLEKLLEESQPVNSNTYLQMLGSKHC